jgi:hypothetical protein
MPEGIIVDPRQNPMENQFGILQENDTSNRYIYLKSINDSQIGQLRFCTAGTPVTFAGVDGLEAIDVNPVSHNNIKNVKPFIARLNEIAHRNLTHLSATVPNYGFGVEYTYDDLPK